MYKDIFFKKENVWDLIQFINAFLKTVSLGKIEIDIDKGVFLENPETI